jgi:hypothetical protein
VKVSRNNIPNKKNATMLTIIAETSPKARKQHVCDFCNNKIEIGETYDKQICSLDGSVYTWKSHIRCKIIAAKLKMYDECYGEGLTGDDFIEEIKGEYDNLMSKNFPEIYKNSNFKHPSFSDQLNFVCKHHDI